MGTTILIPTDFKESSLEPLKALLQFQTEDSINVLLVHGIYLSNSVSDLLFFDQSDLKIEMAGKEFLKKLYDLEKELGPKVASIQIVFFSGFTQSSFEQFTETNKIDRIIIPYELRFDWSHKKSMDVIPFLHKSKIKKQLIAWDTNQYSNKSNKTYITALT
ncbi:hypothetical protein [Fluviicola chungangensis]|uniref:Universal stress protein n=1 Tax=Fluviicola chungangensis TaxID=2597671 RepID=A0A556N7C9_9FLAO|nr:hypothetical protein [Fluviicola chungangensis]TSJ48038.1 hypothetical protein FO442_02590 [Fluviicola chungangensis]